MDPAVKEKPLLSLRVSELRDKVVQAKGGLSLERLRFLREAYKETEGEPIPIRRAKFFDKLLSGMTIFIDENPIVGTLTKDPCGLQPYPEYSCEWMKQETEFYTSLGKTKVSEEDKALLEESVDYWQNKCIAFKARQAFSQKYGESVNYDEITQALVFQAASGYALGRICLDYSKVLTKGLEGVIEEAKTELRKLPLGLLETSAKIEFLNAIIIACRAVIKFARRYASLAGDMAQKEANPKRRLELEKIAESCEWVPAKPARSFYEAIQSFWFVHLAGLIESCSAGHTPGRFPLYMYPFYKKDKEEGKLTEEEGIERLELLFIKFSEIRRFLPRGLFEQGMGNMFQNISVGGLTLNGDDATNEMDYLLLEVQRRVRLPQPTLSVLYHDKLPEDFLLKCVELISTGLGMPAFFNNDVTVQRLLDHGASLEEARDCCIIGCVEGSFTHRAGTLRDGAFNIPKFLELALNNGRDPVTGKQLGPETGEAEAFLSYDELHQAIRRQLQYFMPLRREYEDNSHLLKSEYLPMVFTSALIDDCIKNGKEVNLGGARHYMNGATPVGIIDLADSLAAIKKLVFEEKRITTKELKQILAASFEGCEEIHRMLLDAPKYGNDDDYVDGIAKDWYHIFWEEHQKYKDHLGKECRPVALSITYHFPLGAKVGALPSGRKAGVPLTDATVSPEPGKDRKGPTALLRSATKVIDTIKYGSGQLNMKFHPSSLETRDGLKKLISLVKTYIDLGGHHIQFNVVSADTLKNAQLHPEHYRDLIVRVAGFSAFFIHLDPVVQGEIIKRTELKFG